MLQSKIALFPSRVRPAAEPRSAEQLGFWPLKTRRVYPQSETRGANYGGEVVAENGLRYFVKTTASGPLVPFTEMFSYDLCRSMSVATPSAERIEMLDTSIAFGSRYEPAGDDGSRLLHLIHDDPGVRHSAGIQLSRLVSVDVFLGNQDRSAKNLRWLPAEDSSSRPPTHAGATIGAVVALDFDRAFAALGWPLLQAGFSAGSNSKVFYELIRRKGMLEGGEVGSVLDRLVSLPNGFLEMVLARCSATWLPPGMRDALMHWWTSPARGMRVEEAERYLRHDLKISVRHH